MTTAGAEVRDAALLKLLGRLPTSMERELRYAMGRMAQDHISEMQGRMRRGAGAQSSGFSRVVKSRTGDLFRSFTREFAPQGGGIGGLRMKVFSAGKSYATIQEHGGVVRPIPPRQYLTIPMPANLTASGVPRIASAQSIRYDVVGDGTPRTFVYKSKKGKLFIAERDQVKGKLRLLWMLVRQVTLSGGLGWFDTWRGGADRRRARLQDAARRAIEASRGASAS